MLPDRIARVTPDDPLIDRIFSSGEIRAKYRPVYIEPLVGSGERLTCAFGFILAEGKTLVVNALQREALLGSFGFAGEELFEIVTIVSSSLRAHLSQGGDFENWTPPFLTVTIGQERTARSNTMDSIIRSVRQLYSSLSAPDLNRKTIGQDDESKNIKILSEVKKIIVERNHRLKNSFGKVISVSTQHGPIDYKPDFYGAHFISGLARIGDRIAAFEMSASAKLFDLEQLRQHQISRQIPSLEDRHFGLIICQQEKSAAANNAITKQLDFAEKHSIGLHIVSGPEEAAELIEELEKSAA